MDMKYKTEMESLKELFEENKRKYQPELTKELDTIGIRDMTFEDIHKITLWKVARFPNVSNTTLEQLNNMSKVKSIENPQDRINIKETLKSLLNCSGVRLPMASTYLRFRNPEVFQIIDRHVWHQVYKGNDEGVEEEYTESKTLDEQIDKYLKYLHDLRELAEKDGVRFFDADRFYYWKDKKDGHLIGKKQYRPQ